MWLMSGEQSWTVFFFFCGGSSSGVEELGVVFDVIAHEGVDEEVAVVVALQQETQRQTHTMKCLTSSWKKRLTLVFENIRFLDRN